VVPEGHVIAHPPLEKQRAAILCDHLQRMPECVAGMEDECPRWFGLGSAGGPERGHGAGDGVA
jgi:hypothetical protein